MAVWDDLHTETLYARRRTGSSTNSDGYADPTFGSAFSLTCAYVDNNVRAPISDGQVAGRSFTVQTHTQLEEGDLLFPAGDTGSDVDTGLVVKNVQTMPLEILGEAGDLYVVST